MHWIAFASQLVRGNREHPFYLSVRSGLTFGRRHPPVGIVGRAKNGRSCVFLGWPNPQGVTALVSTVTDRSGSIPGLAGFLQRRYVEFFENISGSASHRGVGWRALSNIPSAIFRKVAHHMGRLSGETDSAVAGNYANLDCVIRLADVLLRSRVYG